jgi:hypothetical protein
MVSRDEPVENAWMRSQARCECRRRSHQPGDRCPQDLVWEHRGRERRGRPRRSRACLLVGSRNKPCPPYNTGDLSAKAAGATEHILW